jgi:hypothetical protein
VRTRTEAVLVVVRLLVHSTRKQRAVVALLELDRVGTGLFGLAEQLARFVQVALVVMADFGDHPTIARVVDDIGPDL